MKFRPASFCTLALAALLAGAGLGQEPSKDKSYYPLQVGNQWTYKSSSGHQVVVRVTKEEKIGDVPCARLETSVEGKAQSSEHLAAKPDGVYRYAGNGVKFDPPILILKLPAKKGETWKVDSKYGSVTIRGGYATTAERVTVPAGAYEAVAVRGEGFQIGDTPAETTAWYAPGVGLVKQVADFGGKKTTLELEKFEAGK